MPHYVSLMRWTSQGRMGLPVWRDRVEEGERTIEEAGGKLVGVYVTLGRYDVVEIFEAPDDEVAIEILMKLNRYGAEHTETLRAFTIGAAFALMVALYVLVNKTRTGKAMRATSYDREAAAMMGIDIDRVITFTFILGSALAGAAGVMFALRVPTTVAIGFVAGLKGFTAAVIGGIGSIPGAMAGGLILGFAESYTQGYVSTKWSDLVVFSILVAFMIFRPQGLLGRADIRKV